VELKELEREAIRFGGLWTAYYYSALIAEKSEEDFFSRIGKGQPLKTDNGLRLANHLTELDIRREEAHSRWSQAVLEHEARLLFAPDQVKLFALDNPHPKLGALSNQTTGEEIEVFLPFKRSRRSPYAYSGRTSYPPTTPRQVKAAFHTLFPLSPYNVMAFAASERDHLTLQQWDRVMAILLGWLWCRQVQFARNSESEEDFFGAIEDLVGHIYLQLVEGVKMKMGEETKQLRPLPPSLLQYEGELDLMEKEALLYARGDSVLDYGERFFRQAIGIWCPSVPQALVEAVPVEGLEGADALLVSYNPIAEWEAKVEVKQTRRSSVEDALKVLTPA